MIISLTKSSKNNFNKSLGFLEGMDRFHFYEKLTNSVKKNEKRSIFKIKKNFKNCEYCKYATENCRLSSSN